MNYTAPIEEIKLRYIIIHLPVKLEIILEELFKDVALTSYNIEDIKTIFQLDVISINQNKDMVISIADIQILNIPYSLIKEFEDIIQYDNRILEVCKTYDSFKIEENREFLMELYNIEMKIREIYTILARLQGINLKNSKVKILKEYQNNEIAFKKRLMNEFFFIEFSDYKNVDRRKDTKLEDLIDGLRQVKRVKDIGNIIIELSHPTLYLEERFNELSRIPDAIGRLENFRNNIAHNRYISENDVENFKKAKGIIDEIHNIFLMRLKEGEI